MFSLFIVLLSIISIISGPLATKCLFLNDEPCMVRPTLIDMNPVELNYYPFMISLKICTGSCNVISPKICVPKETKNINIKAFNMITSKNEAKAMIEHVSCDCKCKKDYSWNPNTCICENSKYLESIADTSATECDEIIIVMDIVSTNKTNTIATNVPSTSSINCYSNKVRDCYILHTFLLVIILLLIITIICYYYVKQKGTI